jgi:hypothetical protein
MDAPCSPQGLPGCSRAQNDNGANSHQHSTTVFTPPHRAYQSCRADHVGGRPDIQLIPTDTWMTLDLHVLRPIVDLYEQSGSYLTRASGSEAATDFNEDTVQQALPALNTQPSFFEKIGSSGGIVMVRPPPGPGLRVAGAWPGCGHSLIATDHRANDFGDSWRFCGGFSQSALTQGWREHHRHGCRG